MSARWTACGATLERRDRDRFDEWMPEEVRASAMTFREAGGRGSRGCGPAPRILRIPEKRTGGVVRRRCGHRGHSASQSRSSAVRTIRGCAGRRSFRGCNMFHLTT